MLMRDNKFQLPIFLKALCYLHHGRLPFDIEGAPSTSLQRAMHILGSACLKTLEKANAPGILNFINEEEDPSLRCGDLANAT
jgi:hypothetical protein